MASNQPTASDQKKLSPDILTAKNWYLWLWLSPFLTIPTWAFLLGVILLATGGRDFPAPVVVFSVFGSACWHLILLIPALAGKNEFVCWHGRQALLMACLHTIVMLLIVLVGVSPSSSWKSNVTCFGGLVMLAIWIFGNRWGQGQAGRGDCWLMRKVGRGAGLPVVPSMPPMAADSAGSPDKPDHPAYVDSLVETIRFDPNPEKRRAALVELEQIGFVEHLS